MFKNEYALIFVTGRQTEIGFKVVWSNCSVPRLFSVLYSVGNGFEFYPKQSPP